MLAVLRAAILNPGVVLTTVSGVSVILLGRCSQEVSDIVSLLSQVSLSRPLFHTLWYCILLLYLVGGIITIYSPLLFKPVVAVIIFINLIVVVTGCFFTLAEVTPTLVDCAAQDKCEGQLEEVMQAILLVFLSSVIASVSFYYILWRNSRPDNRPVRR